MIGMLMTGGFILLLGIAALIYGIWYRRTVAREEAEDRARLH